MQSLAQLTYLQVPTSDIPCATFRPHATVGRLNKTRIDQFEERYKKTLWISHWISQILRRYVDRSFNEVVPLHILRQLRKIEKSNPTEKASNTVNVHE